MQPSEIEVFYDGECPLCMREVKMLRGLDKHARIEFTDIAAPTFDARARGFHQEDLMARIHARLPNGETVVGVEVFRRLYDAVGFGAAVSVSRLPVIRDILDEAYLWFAENRLRITGRCEGEACARSSSQQLA